MYDTLQGMSIERVNAVNQGLETYDKAQRGIIDDDFGTAFLPMYHEIAKDLVKQRKRLGGNWAIAQAVFTKAQREVLRQNIGSDLIFIVLNLTRECQKKRLAARHGDNIHEELVQMLEKFYDLFEKAGDDEPNTYNLTVTEDMNVEDVMNKILDIIDKHL